MVLSETMFRDPLYRQIRRRLRELSDGNKFEMCANDILQRIYPAIAPREGGDDAGLDGTIANEDQSCIQLICTTGRDVIGNLSKSIKANLKKGGDSHSCILATSQRLTNSEKRKLHSRAGQLGRPLMQIYDQAGIAQLLYREPRWLKELLGLTGEPSSLSVFPITNRPLLDVPPIGRDDDIQKLVTCSNDLVLVGQPGSGKTHLLFTTAKKAKGRFVVDEDLGRIANEVRNLQPRFLIIDDAHSRLEFVRRLKHMRQTINADYHIIASCWPGQQDGVCASLQVSIDKCHTLDGLPQKQIKEVIESQRILGPLELVAEIIHQSQGKPGLAVTLCRLCWEAGTHDVVLGTALARDVRQSFEPLLGQNATHLLGCFSLGGSAGMTLETAAGLVGKSTFEVKRIVEQLAAAGVLDVGDKGSISVHPFRLRQALVRDVFLKPPVMDLEPLLAQTPDFASTTRVLIQAKAIGGDVADGLLQQRLRQVTSSFEKDAFQEYAQLGRREGEWILDQFPDKLDVVAPVTLQSNPEKTLLMLLDAALEKQRRSGKERSPSRADEIIPEIKRWVLSGRPGDTAATKRREILANILARWPAASSEPFISIPAAIQALSIEYEDSSSPPGEPNVITIHRGLIAQNQLPQVAALWPKLRSILREANASQTSQVAQIFHEWVHPDVFHEKLPPEYLKQSRRYARQIIRELLEDFTGKWSFHHHLRRYAEQLNLGEFIVIDPIAEVLFPSREFQDWEAEQQNRNAAAEKLALELMKQEPQSVANLLITVEEEARAANITELSSGGRVFRRIAEMVNGLTPWIAALLDQQAPPHMVDPFLRKLVSDSSSAAEDQLLKALAQPQLRSLCVDIAVEHYSPGSRVWSQSSQYFRECSHNIGALVFRNCVPEQNVVSLLRFSEAPVAQSVAVNLRKRAKVPDGLLEEWKNVIVTSEDPRHEHSLESIFKELPDVAFRWIAKRLDEVRSGARKHWAVFRHDRALRTAVNVLGSEERKALIDKLTSAFHVSDLVRLLVGRDLHLYQHLLSREDLKDLHLTPLELGPYNDGFADRLDDKWHAMAMAALEKGFAAEKVFMASQGSGGGWTGPTSGMYAAKLEVYEHLVEHPDVRLQSVGRLAVVYFSKLRDHELAAEKRAAIRGEIY